MAQEHTPNRSYQKLAGLKPYVFARLDERVYQLREQGVKDIVDLGKADPDHPTPEVVVRRLQETAADPNVVKGMDRIAEYLSGKELP